VATSYPMLVRSLSRQWSKTIDANFQVGRIIDQIHNHYSRQASYSRLSQDLGDIGTKVAADTLRCYHHAYRLHRRIPKKLAKRLVDLPHSFWIEAARRGRGLSDNERFGALATAATNKLSASQLRHDLEQRLVEEKRHHRISKKPTRSGIRLVLGDCLEQLRKLRTNSVDVVVTSPPFNTLPSNSKPSGVFSHNKWLTKTQRAYADSRPEEEYQAWLAEVLRECSRVAKGLVWMHHKLRVREKQAIHPVQFIAAPLYTEVIWDRGISMSLNAKRFSLSHDYLLAFGKPHYWDSTVNAMMSVWRIPPRQREKTAHPCPWPLEIPRRLIRSSCPPGGKVLDPFCGVGTTAMASIREGCRFVGFELETGYFQEAEKNIAATLRQEDQAA